MLAVDERGIRLDRTVFYPQGGGQAGERACEHPEESGGAMGVAPAAVAVEIDGPRKDR